MMGNPGRPLRPSFILPLLVPLLGGWCFGFFLREIQASIVPYQQFLLIGSLAGHVQFTPPRFLFAVCQVGVPLIWLVWSLLFHRWRTVPVAEALRAGGWTYLPLLVLPAVVFVVEFESLRWVKWVLDAMLLTAVAAVCAGKAWLWSGRCPPVPPKQGTGGSLWVWGMFLVAAGTFATLGVMQYRAWNVPAVDTGSLEQLQWNTLDGRFLYSTIERQSVFETHVMLTQLLWTPLYALWPSVEWLTILQSLAVAAGVFPLWWMARRHWDDRRALWFPLLYLLQPALHFAVADINYNTYRTETFLIPLVLFGACCLEQNRFGWAALFGLLVLLGREDMGVVIACAGLYVGWKKRLPLAGLALVVVGIGYFVLCVHVVIPSFSSQNRYPFVWPFGGLGETPAQIALNLFTQPGAAFRRLLQPANVLFLTYLFLPLGWLWFGRFAFAWMAAPMLAAAMLTAGGVHNSIYFHCHNVPFALLVAATPAGAAALAAWLSNRFRCAPRRTQSLLLGFALGAAATATLIGSKTPLSLNFYWPPTSPFHHAAVFQRSTHTALLERRKKSIPREARVCATIFAATHFTHYRDCFLFGDRFPEAEYVLVDVKARWSKGARAYLQRWGESGLPGFDPIWIEDGVFLFRKRPATDAAPPAASGTATD